MSTSADSTDVTALIECSLCLTTFQLPKCLPCIHTFCLDCLQKYVDQNEISDKLPCPLCRLMCDIPPQGLSSLPNNFFILRMIELERKFVPQSERLDAEVKCDLCLDENDDPADTPTAVKFCVECVENLCQSCVTYHAKLKATKSHALVLLSEKSEAAVKSARYHPRSCDKHSNQPMHLYCLKCDVCLCVSCMLIDHNEHKCEDIKDAFTRYLNQFDVNISEVRDVLALGHKSAQDLKDVEERIVAESRRNEGKIRERCDELRKILADYEEELLSETRTFKEKRVKEITSRLEEVEFQNLQLEGYVRYLNEFKEKGSNFDVACNGKELVSRAEQLVTSSNKTFTREMKISHVNFITDDLHCKLEFGRKYIGELITGEKLLITVGLNDGDDIQQKIFQIGLEPPNTINVINSTPAEISCESAACVVNNVLYAVGVGGACNELWAWSASRDEWTRCADMSDGRRFHCVTSVGDKIYVLGGFVDADKRTLDSILCYDINSNKWSEASQLCHAVESGTCVTYKHQVYVFGGDDRDWNTVDHVQIYDTATGIVSLASNPMPNASNLMRAVAWRSKALIIGCDTCYIYDFESNTWQERKRFKTDVIHFGLTLDSNRLYISGGGTDSAGVWTCRADVKSLSVDDFISDREEVEWDHHASLPSPTLVQAYNETPLYKL